MQTPLAPFNPVELSDADAELFQYCTYPMSLVVRNLAAGLLQQCNGKQSSTNEGTQFTPPRRVASRPPAMTRRIWGRSSSAWLSRAPAPPPPRPSGTRCWACHRYIATGCRARSSSARSPPSEPWLRRRTVTCTSVLPKRSSCCTTGTIIVE